MIRPDGRPDTQVTLAERFRAGDDRIPYVERAFLDQRLGLFGDLDLMDDAAVAAIFALPVSVTYAIGASRLLEQLDAHEARQHPVDLEFHGPITTATVPVGDDDSVRLTLEDGRIHLPHQDLIDATLGEGAGPGAQPALTSDDAEALAHALLRLVQLHRSSELLEEPTAHTDQVIGIDNGPRRSR